MPVSKAVLSALGPYLESSGPNGSDEWGMRCPLHDDQKRSASLNVRTGKWYCQACDFGGDVRKLVKNLKSQNAEDEKESEPFPFNDGHIKAWASALSANRQAREEFRQRRGLSDEIIDEYEIGWDEKHKCYTIPIRDVNGELINVRSYQLDPADGRRKIWSVKNFGSPTLFPIDQLCETDEVIICEGELDALLTIQNGFNAITRTGGATSWNPDWNEDFRGMKVFVCQDADRDGQRGALKIVKNLRDVATEVHVINLPYEVTEKHGKDLTDFWLDGYEVEILEKLMAKSRDQAIGEETSTARTVSVLETFNTANIGESLGIRVTVTGKRNPSHAVDRKIQLECTMDAGPKCKGCSMMMAGGSISREILPNDPMVMQMIESTDEQVMSLLRQQYDIQKCNRLFKETIEYQAVEELYVRPALDEQAGSDDPGAFVTRRILAVGQHDTFVNETVYAIGAHYPNPRNQKSEFQTWNLRKVETNIEKFRVTEEVLENLTIFQTDGMSPMHKLEEIADDLAQNVTRIYNRMDMHIFMDLVFHSVLGFELLGEQIHKGWLDGLIIGDTRTGKSAAAGALQRHYQVGEMISCESASFAGVVGGLHQMGNQVWEVSWGSVPLNDRRIVVLDEVSGLSREEISRFSSIRSSGVAELTKIRSEKTHARTRLLWLGNPRQGIRMQDFTYGIQAIQPLVGNNEDIARFDMAMSVSSGDVESQEINSSHASTGNKYTQALCHDLLLWAWSRQSDQIVLAPGTEQAILNISVLLGKDFCEYPPLVQAANIRVKLARIGIAMAARLFSCDSTGEKIVVHPRHIEAAREFLLGLYENPRFGYGDISREALQDLGFAGSSKKEVFDRLLMNPSLVKALRKNSRFKRVDLEDMLGMTRDQLSREIAFLTDTCMISRDGSFIRCSPVLQDILRELAP